MIIALVLIGILALAAFIMGARAITEVSSQVDMHMSGFRSQATFDREAMQRALALAQATEKKLTAFAANEQLGWGKKEVPSNIIEEGWIPIEEVETQERVAAEQVARDMREEFRRMTGIPRY